MKTLRRVLSLMLVLAMFVTMGIVPVNASDVSEEVNNSIEKDLGDTTKTGDIGAEDIEAEDGKDITTNNGASIKKSVIGDRKNFGVELQNGIVPENVTGDVSMKISDLAGENNEIFSSAKAASSTTGLPQYGYGITRSADDAYDGSAVFVGRISIANTSISKWSTVIQIYTWSDDSNKWVAKDGTRQILVYSDIPYSSGYFGSAKNFEFTLEKGETCVVYPVYVGYEEYAPYYPNNWSFRVCLGLKYTDQYQISKLNNEEITKTMLYKWDVKDRWSKLDIQTIELTSQTPFEWKTENGLPNGGLQIEYDVEEGIDSFNFANVQVGVRAWLQKEQNMPYMTGLYYNGLSNLGAMTKDGYLTDNSSYRGAILCRAELYEKNADGTYTKNRTLTDHLYCLYSDDAAKLFQSFQSQLNEDSVKTILKNGGVISIVPLNIARDQNGTEYSYSNWTQRGDLTNAQNAPVFGFDYQIESATKSSEYAVSIDNAVGSVGSEKRLDGTGIPLQKVTVKVSKTEQEGLWIDGAGIPVGTTEHLYIHLTPSKGHDYEGKSALRFLARVYKKNGDGTYTAKEITESTLFENWDIVQMDATSPERAMYGFSDWQSDRYIECDLASDEVLMIYPVAWDDSKSNQKWFEVSNDWLDSLRYATAFASVDKLDTDSWSFSYRIGIGNTLDNLLIGATCENGEVQVENAILSSKKDVASGNCQKVILELDTAENVDRISEGDTVIPDGGLVLNFEGLNDMDMTYSQFSKNIVVYLRTVANGTNGSSMGNDSTGDELDFKMRYYDSNGTLYSEKVYYNYNYSSNSDSYMIKTTSLSEFCLDDMTEEEYNILKAGGKLAIVPVKHNDNVNARFYSFEYAFAARTDTVPFQIDKITDNNVELTADEDVYYGAQMLHYKDVRKADVTISLSENENTVEGISSNIRSDGDGAGLPDYGLMFTVDGTAEANKSLGVDIKVTAPREKKNNEGPLEDSRVQFQLLRFVKDSSTGMYKLGAFETLKTAEYPDSECCVYKIDASFFGEGTSASVYVLLPVKHELKNQYSGITEYNLMDEFEFTAQITGVRVMDYDITGIQENAEEIDPLDSTVEWSEIKTGTGIYGDIFPAYTLSSDGESSRLMNLKLNVAGHEAAVQALPEIISNGTDLTAENMENMVVIRNSAKDYTAENTDSTLMEDSMPDVLVTVKASLQRGENAASNWGGYWGYDPAMQFPYQAFLYNYKDGTYTKLDTADYYSFDTSENPISGPASGMWGVYPGGGSSFHTHLADNQAIVIVACSNYYSFSYQVMIKNSDKYTIDSYTFSDGSLSQEYENLYQSSTIASYEADGVTDYQEVVLTTARTLESNVEKTFAPLSYSLPEGLHMRKVEATLFNYDFPGLTKEDYSGQTSKYKFLYDPLNCWDYRWNHIGNNKTQEYAGILQDTLENDGMPVFNYSVPFNLFDEQSVSEVTNGGTKEVYPSRFEFVYDEATGTYSYNSHLHHAQLEEDGTIRQFDKGLGITGWGNQSAGFFPFNRWENENGTWGSSATNNSNTYLLAEEDLDYHFGMSIVEDFVVPLGGSILGNDMVFSISGDDDIWMFVDGVLVLDIGGIHEAIEGEINFTQGTYLVNGETKQLSDLFEDFEGFGELTGSWAAGTKHTFEFFYLERGGTLSNMDISFNVPILIDFDITKQVKSEDPKALEKSYHFTVELYEDEEGTESYTGEVLVYDEETNTFSKVETTEGKFELELKAAETRKFYAQPGIYYSVTEDAYNEFNTSWSTDGQTAAEGESSGIISILSSVVCTNTEKPEEPEEPESPEEPEEPEEPESPEEPKPPVTPESPEEPKPPVTPESPEEPKPPVTPETPEEPEPPAIPESPEEPTTPVTPETPEQPATPVTPEPSVEPESPVESETVKTGDTAPIMGMVLIVVLSGGSLCVIENYRKKKNKIQS